MMLVWSQEWIGRSALDGQQMLQDVDEQTTCSAAEKTVSSSVVHNGKGSARDKRKGLGSERI